MFSLLSSPSRFLKVDEFIWYDSVEIVCWLGNFLQIYEMWKFAIVIQVETSFFLYFHTSIYKQLLLRWIQSFKLKPLVTVGAGRFTGLWRWDSAMASSHSRYSSTSKALQEMQGVVLVLVQQEVVQNTICVIGRQNLCCNFHPENNHTGYTGYCLSLLQSMA